ncbi:MAG: gamma-glutamylcyclotransferase family protein [Herbiconiux sp.]|nr:gamma-glutamylcyclotransferase family protein [Herbiconiux sp.]
MAGFATLGGMATTPRDATESLFSYGTLRQPEVQLATFGRLLSGREAVVEGYRLEWLTITDPQVIAMSGSDRHPLLVPVEGAGRGDERDLGRRAEHDRGHGAEHGDERGADRGVPGTVFEITPAELAAADAYEVDDYERVLVPLVGGGTAWVYVFGGGAPRTA